MIFTFRTICSLLAEKRKQGVALSFGHTNRAASVSKIQTEQDELFFHIETVCHQDDNKTVKVHLTPKNVFRLINSMHVK